MPHADGVAFLMWALPRLGLRWEGFRNVRGQVLKRIARRHRSLGLDDLAGYRRYLEDNPSEWAELDALCRVTITRFGRDRGVFHDLRRTVLPELAQRGPIRCWSAGCASGEEPYTLALIDRFDSPGAPLDIVATEANAALLGRAARARYPRGTLRELPPEWIDAAFVAENDELMLRGDIAARVRFLEHDLRRDPPPAGGPFDLVLCRNMAFTYFDAAGQRAALDMFDGSMSDGAALVLGSHERVLSDPRFAPWARAIYRRIGSPGYARAECPSGSSSSTTARRSGE